MVKSVFCCCVRGRRLFSNPVTYYKFYTVLCINVCVLAKPIIYRYLCRLFSNAWLKDVHLNHDRKVPNALWTITCTHSIKLITTASKVFIKIYNTDISIDCLFVLCSLDSSCIVTNPSSVHNCAFFLDRLESLTEYLITPVIWVTITCQCRTIMHRSFFLI